MYLPDLLERIGAAGVILRCHPIEDRLNAKPTRAVTPELRALIADHKMELIGALREDEQMRRSGIVQSEAQVFRLAREHFGTKRALEE